MKRFSRYEFSLKSLRPKGTDADANPVVPDAPANTPLREFQLFKAGKKKINIIRTAASLQGSLGQAVVQAFGFPSTTNNKINVTISGRAVSAAGALSVSLTDDLNHLVGGDGRDLPGFQPAKAIVKNPTTTTGTAPEFTSQITGAEYKTRKGPNYTFPFGAGTTVDEAFELDAREKIYRAITLGLPKAQVSFKPESFRKR